MPRYRLEGYNSGGYHSFRDVEFDGKLEYIHYYDELDKDIPKTIKYIQVTHPDGTVTHEDNEFLQKLLDEQSYIESFLTVGIEELTDEMIAQDKERKVDIWSVDNAYAEEKKSYLQQFEAVLDVFYKTRYLLIVPLLYLAGQWLEGPPIRTVLLSNTFMITVVSLLIYSAIFVNKTTHKKYPVSFLIFNVLFVLSYLYMILNNHTEVDKNFEATLGVLMGFFGIHFVYWLVSLFKN